VGEDASLNMRAAVPLVEQHSIISQHMCIFREVCCLQPEADIIIMCGM